MGTLPPLFPDISLMEEKPGESPAVCLIHDGVGIEVPPILLAAEHAPAPAGAGDGRLHVTARDPHWLYIYWDLTREQQAKLNAESRHGHLIVRVYANSLQGELAGENHVHPQSRHWFTHVETPGATYFTELGFYVGQEWRRVGTAGPVTTSRKHFAFDTSATFVTLHPDQPIEGKTGPKSDSTRESSAVDEPRFIADLPDLSIDFSQAQQLAVLRALGVIRVAETASGEFGAAETNVAERSWLEVAFASSPGGGFNEVPAAVDLGGEFPAAVSSSDVPWFSLAGLPSSSS